MESIKELIDKHQSDYNTLNNTIQNIITEIKDKYVVWFQSRLKSVDSLYEKIHVRNISIEKINDIIGFRIIYPWTKQLYEIADILQNDKYLNIQSRIIYEDGKVIYLYGKTSIDTIYEIQLWPTIIYTCFEYEHDKIYKPKEPITDKQRENAIYVRKKEQALQEYLDSYVLVPYDK